MKNDVLSRAGRYKEVVVEGTKVKDPDPLQVKEVQVGDNRYVVCLTRPIFHKQDETIRGHVFCSFLALVLRKELQRRLDIAGHKFEWNDIKQDLRSLQETTIEENGKSISVRSQCAGVCGKVFQAVGVAVPPTIREL
ncbi:MAG: hypothetical protein HOC09_26755 [Deltaproteobacteria bacterium]|nr:hypothetical protein [Deltaproteobacteria bacterium]